jgi:hypothetical protein
MMQQPNQRLTPAALAVLKNFVLSRVTERSPDELIPPDGLPSIYLERWYVQRSRETGNTYIHRFLRSDDDRALHDHPWGNVSVLVRGSYIEHTPDGSFVRNEGDVLYRRAAARHRVELIDGEPVWTLFMTGPKVRDWGFHCRHGFVPWWEFDMAGCGVDG